MNYQDREVIKMNWSDKQQARFDELRQQELAGTLSGAEIEELEALTALS